MNWNQYISDEIDETDFSNDSELMKIIAYDYDHIENSTSEIATQYEAGTSTQGVKEDKIPVQNP